MAKGNPLTDAQAAKAREMRDRGLTWAQIGKALRKTPSQVRHKLGEIRNVSPKKISPRPKQPPRPREQVRAYQELVAEMLGMSHSKFRAIRNQANEVADKTSRPRAEVWDEYGVPAMKTLRERLKQ
jgi:hypothetical protein